MPQVYIVAALPILMPKFPDALNSVLPIYILVIMLRQFFDNGEAGIRIVGSTNFTFDATIGSSSDEGEGYVGSLDGQQPVEVVVESSTSVIFEDMSVRSTNGEISFGRPHPR